MFGIGVDADQGYLGQHVLTSATKKVDVAVFATIEAAQKTRCELPHELRRHLLRQERTVSATGGSRPGSRPRAEGARREHPEADRRRQDQGHRAVSARDHGLEARVHRKGRGFDPAPSGITPSVSAGRCSLLLAWCSCSRSPAAAATTTSGGSTTAAGTTGGDDDRRPAGRRSRSASSRTSAASTTAPSTSSRTRASSRPRSELGVDRPRRRLARQRRLRPQPLQPREPGLRPRDRRRLPDGRRRRRGREAVPGRRTSRSSTSPRRS